MSKKQQIGLKIDPDGTCTTVQCAKLQFSLEELQKAVGGYVEMYPLGHHSLYLNEEGKLMGLEPNPIATRLMRQQYPGSIFYVTGEQVVGSVIIVGTTLYDPR